MKSRILLTLACALIFAPATALAQDALTARQQLITERCQTFGSLLDQIQRRDLVSRTNLGREYENIARQLSAFNQRLRHNGYNAAQYEQLLVELNNATTQFREFYVRYDDHMNELRQINCRTNPADFDKKLVETRALRGATQGATTHAAALVGQYRLALGQLQASLPEAPEAVQ